MQREPEPGPLTPGLLAPGPMLLPGPPETTLLNPAVGQDASLIP